MKQEAPPYADVLASIRARLTGDPRRDLPFLNEQSLRYRDEPWAGPFLREIGRLVFDLLPPEVRDEAAEAVASDMQRYEDLRQRAWEHLQQGQLEEALREASELLEAVQTFGRSDLDATYFDYEDPLEEEFHRGQGGAPATARPSPLSHQPALVLLSQVHLARGEEGEALETLGRAIGRAPAGVLARFLRLNLLKRRGEVDLAFQEGLQVLPLCHTSRDLAQGFRHLAWCLADQARWEPAAAALLVSLHHEWNRLALQELAHVLEASAGIDLEDCAERALDLLARQGVPPTPDPRWLVAARALQERCRAAGDPATASWCSEVLATLEAPLDLDAVVRRVQSERVQPPEEQGATPAGRYLGSLQRELLGWVSRTSLQEGRSTLTRELEEAEDKGQAPFWAGQAEEVTEEEWDQSLLFGQPILADMGTMLLQAAERLELPAGPAGAWGVLPLPALMARVLVAPTGQRVPVVSSGWLLFAHLMAKVTASCLPVRTRDGKEGLSFDRELVEAHLATDRTAQQRFAELMTATSRGDAGQAPTWILAGAAAQVGSLLCESAELFLMAEQLSIAETASAVQDEKLGRRVTVSRLAPDRDAQVRATVVALQLAAAVQAERGLGFPLCAAGIVSCLYGAALAEGLQVSERDGFLTAGYRCQVVLHVLREKAPQALELAETLIHALGMLWKAHRG